MIKALGDTEATSEQLSETLKEIAKLFGSSGATISSFELLKSGLVDGLLAFATETGRIGLWNIFSCIDPKDEDYDDTGCRFYQQQAHG
jgi:hypothetical protein